MIIHIILEKRRLLSEFQIAIYKIILFLLSLTAYLQYNNNI